MNESPESTTPVSQKQGSDEASANKKIARRPVACKSCHSLKVKCTPADESNPGGPCIRCLNARRVCEIDLNQPRKRRRKAEIEEEREAKQKSEEARSQTPVKQSNGTAPLSKEDTIKDLTEQVKRLKEQLHQQNRAQKPKSWTESPMSEAGGAFVSKSDLEDELHALSDNGADSFAALTAELKKAASNRYDFIAINRYPIDLISKKILTLEKAEERLKMYQNFIYEKFPYVEIPKDVTAAELSKTQPFLFNAVMAVANIIHPEASDFQSQIIDTEATRAICTEVFVAGTKNEELLKAVLLLCLWYNTPELFRQRRYQLLNSVAICMIHDLGIVARCTYFYSGESKFKLAPKTETTIEQRRMVLMLYVSTITICLILRRSIYVKWTPYIQDCCVFLENSDDEKLVELAVFARLNFQLERIHSMIHSPDMSFESSSTNEYLIRELQKNLNTIKDTICPDNHSLMAYYYSVEAYLHEPVLSQVLESVKDDKNVSLSETSIRAIVKCTTSCLKALTEFITIGAKQIAIVPLIYIARVIYTGGMLLRLRYLILSLPSHIEKDLVPRSVITVIQDLNNVMMEVSRTNPNNYSVKKTSLMFQLFIQTYSTQVQQLLNREGDTPDNFKPVQKQFSKKAGLLAEQDNLRQPVPLDILSYAAAFRKESQNKEKTSLLGTDDGKMLSFSTTDYVRHKLDNVVSEGTDRAGVDSKQDNSPSAQKSETPQPTRIPYATPTSNGMNGVNPPVMPVRQIPPPPIMNPPSNYIPNAAPQPPLVPPPIAQAHPPINIPTDLGYTSASNFSNPMPYENMNTSESVDVWDIGEEFWSDILNPTANNFNLENKRNTAMTEDIFYMRS